MKQRTLGCLTAIVLLALLVSVSVNLLLLAGGAGAAMASSAAKKRPLSEVVESEGGADRIVEINLEGMITSMRIEGIFSSGLSTVESLKTQLEQAAGDERVKAVVLRINSPGGEVTASDTLFHAVKTVAAAKPVVVFMDAMAASGGYYTACGATKIVASETTLTGSIGVIIDALNYSGLFEKVGLKSNTFVSGAFKDSLNGARPMRAEEEAYIQSLVTGMYERFLKVVADGRGIATDVLRNGVADGRVLSGKEALDAGLVDQLGYIEDARRLAAELAGVKDPTLVRYRRETGFFDILGGVSAPFAGRGDSGRTVRLELAPGAYPALTPGLPYYLAPLSVPAR